MTNEYAKFADGYIEKNIVADGYPPEGDNSVAEMHAKKCAQKAISAGLNATKFEFMLSMTLTQYIANAIGRINDAEVERQSDKDQ